MLCSPVAQDIAVATVDRIAVSIESKLVLKNRAIRVVGAPAGFQLRTGNGAGVDPALLVFVTNEAALEKHLAAILASARADRLTWVAYPKGGQLGTDLNRDSLARILSGKGVQPVTQVSIDSVWSALRFRPGKAK